MRFARPALAAVGCVAALLILSGCSKPTPGVSVFSGSTSQYHNAICWAPAPAYVDSAECTQTLEAASAATVADPIHVSVGDTVGISVDPTVAEQGWAPLLNGAQLTSNPLSTTYFRFTVKAEDLQQGNATLGVAAGDQNGTRGLWVFALSTD